MTQTRPVEVSQVFKSFGTTQAVADVSFAVEHGEILGLLGPNGAGKTTTIRIVLDIFKPDRGTVSVLGEEGSTLPTNVFSRSRMWCQKNCPVKKNVFVRLSSRIQVGRSKAIIPFHMSRRLMSYARPGSTGDGFARSVKGLVMIRSGCSLLDQT